MVELVRKERLELSRVTPLEPKSSASTNSATLAEFHRSAPTGNASCRFAGQSQTTPSADYNDKAQGFEPQILKLVLGLFNIQPFAMCLVDLL